MNVPAQDNIKSGGVLSTTAARDRRCWLTAARRRQNYSEKKTIGAPKKLSRTIDPNQRLFSFFSFISTEIFLFPIERRDALTSRQLSDSKNEKFKNRARLHFCFSFSTRKTIEKHFLDCWILFQIDSNDYDYQHNEIKWLGYNTLKGIAGGGVGAGSCHGRVHAGQRHFFF